MSRDAIVFAWNALSADEKISIAEVSPALAETVADMAALAETRNWRTQAMQMKMRSLQETGAHVPVWIRQEAALR